MPRLGARSILMALGAAACVLAAASGHAGEAEPPSASVGDTVAAQVLDRLAGMPVATRRTAENLFAEMPGFFAAPGAGDGFAVVRGQGGVLAVSLTHAGATERLYRLPRATGRALYVDAGGAPMPRALVRRPVDGGRLCLGFGTLRHPILDLTRLHDSVQWCARAGAAVVAAGDGTVIETGRDARLGYFIRLRHPGGLETVYGHLAAAATLRTGAAVRQGDVIGAAGKSGLTTGSGLHYEVRQADMPVDPLTVALPPVASLEAADQAALAAEKGRLDAALDAATVRLR